MHIRNQRVKAEREPGILRRHDQFGKEVRNHFLRHAKRHLHITHHHTAPDQMLSDLQVPDVAQHRRIRRNVHAGLGVRIETVRLWATKAEKANHILRVQQLLARDARGHKLSRTRRVHHDGLLQ